jgi:acyl-coenzyme A thioesterase PaaI-like protein
VPDPVDATTLTRLRSFVRDERLLEWYGPFRHMRVRVLEATEGWRRLRLLLPLNRRTRNLQGTVFGGAQAALADPVPALVCARLFPGLRTVTRDLTLDFEAPGTGDLELRFVLVPTAEEDIRVRLAAGGRARPRFGYGFYREDGVCCTRVTNTVDLRPAS